MPIPITSVLIANRGEIACRIIRTCRLMGLRTISVYSEVDAQALHTKLADQRVPIGPAPASESYLCADRLIEAALLHGAQAIHPGYGFLSENADFAEMVIQAGLIFIGPAPDAIRAMGSKSTAKVLMEQAGVPLVPGYHEENQSVDRLTAAAQEIGFPLLIKAVAGGGGKGMRRVDDIADFVEALAGARREARASFADDRMLLERYLTAARHIEIQIFADSYGNGVFLFERDCSVQRRHQKIIEEAPAPGLCPAQRAAMGQAALTAAQAVGYCGAGTVEFISVLEQGVPGPFYFMEMNTRLQVEHPVTETITGLDLVEWQIRIASGEALPCQQSEITLDGHAIEARLYAENPELDYRPSTGSLVTFHLPPPPTRIDTGVQTGDRITSYYDPMLAKLIVHGPNRSAALNALKTALSQTIIVGVETNRDLLIALCADADFAAGRFDTGLLERKPALLRKKDTQKSLDDKQWALSAMAEILYRQRAASSVYTPSPWSFGDGWRLNAIGTDTLRFILDQEVRDPVLDLTQNPEIVPPEIVPPEIVPIEIPFLYKGDHFHLTLPNGSSIKARGTLDSEDRLETWLNGVRQTGFYSVWEDHNGQEQRSLITETETLRLRLYDPEQEQADPEATSGELRASIPGRVTKIHVKSGDPVRRGSALLVIEAMKTENTLTAPKQGQIKELHCVVGDQIEEYDLLIVIESS